MEHHIRCEDCEKTISICSDLPLANSIMSKHFWEKGHGDFLVFCEKRLKYNEKRFEANAKGVTRIASFLLAFFLIGALAHAEVVDSGLLHNNHVHVDCLAKKKPADPPVWKVLLAEAGNQGYKGMYAVACVIRTRNGNLKGFYGAARPDLNSFCERQGSYYQDMAKEAYNAVFVKNGPDITQGATHFENIKAFGVPSWAKGVIPTCTIKDHTFYRL